MLVSKYSLRSKRSGIVEIKSQKHGCSIGSSTPNPPIKAPEARSPFPDFFYRGLYRRVHYLTAMAGIALISGLVLLLMEKDPHHNLTRNAFDITRLTYLEKWGASFLVCISARFREIRHYQHCRGYRWERLHHRNQPRSACVPA